MIFISGRVVLDDGSVLTDSPSIQTVCKNQSHTETHADSKGNFSFHSGSGSATSNDAGFDVDTSSPAAGPGNPDRRDLQYCQLQASLPVSPPMSSNSPDVYPGVRAQTLGALSCTV